MRDHRLGGSRCLIKLLLPPHPSPLPSDTPHAPFTPPSPAPAVPSSVAAFGCRLVQLGLSAPSPKPARLSLPVTSPALPSPAAGPSQRQFRVMARSRGALLLQQQLLLLLLLLLLLQELKLEKIEGVTPSSDGLMRERPKGRRGWGRLHRRGWTDPARPSAGLTCWPTKVGGERERGPVGRGAKD